MNNLFATGITEYITHYCDVSPKGYNADGTLTHKAIVQGVQCLLDGGVFSSFKQIQESALRGYGIILPLSYCKCRSAKQNKREGS